MSARSTFRILLVIPTLVAAALAIGADDAGAQMSIAASEFATVAQVVDGTLLEVKYSRPRVRGRRNVFGERVKWGEVWTPGANMATTLSVSNDVTIDGVKVPKGTWSVWFVVEKGPWELVLDPDTTLAHTQMPKKRPGQIRMPLKREKGPFTEALTFTFPDVRTDGVTLVMQWDTVAVPLRIGVTPSFTRAVAADVARPLVGRYRMKFEPFPDSISRKTDTTLHVVDDEPGEHTLTVRYEEGELRATMDPPMYRTEEGYSEWIVIPFRGSTWTLGRLWRGELVEVFGLALRFEIVGGTARSFEMRLPNDALALSGVRLDPGR